MYLPGLFYTAHYAGMYCQLRFKEHLSDDNDVELPEPVPPNKEQVERPSWDNLRLVVECR